MPNLLSKKVSKRKSSFVKWIMFLSEHQLVNKNQEPSIKFLTAWPLKCQIKLLTKEIRLSNERNWKPNQIQHFRSCCISFCQKKVPNTERSFWLNLTYLPAINKLEIGTFENSAIRSCCISFCHKSAKLSREKGVKFSEKLHDWTKFTCNQQTWTWNIWKPHRIQPLTHNSFV